ncbi:Hypp9202 [Branchiostoma lanceolatum]|uniref:Hypp9202 protein n=1 Tax=Branchiostoma lanceolatum TaxID=7740 RepID=A0A8K0EKW3_BRALA|nr:Hypp9202 [Branchiostoma lanceolatum]
MFPGYLAAPVNPECSSLDNIISHIQAPPGGTIQCHRNDSCTGITCSGTALAGAEFHTSASLQHCSSPVSMSVNVVVPSLEVNYQQTVRHNDMYEIPGLSGDVPVLGTQEHIQGYLQVKLEKKDQNTLSIGVKLLGGTEIFGMMVYPLEYDVIPEQDVSVPSCTPVLPTPVPVHPATRPPHPPRTTVHPKPPTRGTVKPKPAVTTAAPDETTTTTQALPTTPAHALPPVDPSLQCKSIDQMANNVTSLMPTLATIMCNRNADCTGVTCSAQTKSDIPVKFAMDVTLHGCTDPVSMDVTINSEEVGLDHTQTVTQNGTYQIEDLKVPIAGFSLPAVYQVNMARVNNGMDVKLVLGLSNGPVQYSFFQLGEQTIIMPPCPSDPGTASRKHTADKHNTMVIVGAVVGSVLGLVMLVVLGLLIRRWRKPSLSVYGDMQVLMSASNEDFEPLTV